MTTQILNIKANYKNTAVYVDYENIYELLRNYDINPIKINFFSTIIKILTEEHKLNIIDFIVYNNFEKNPSNRNLQTKLRSMGLQTRHSSNNGKNSGDLELTVDALKTLYKNQAINVFVIISSDRDIIPLLKAIKYENKFTYVFSTKNGFNKIITQFADHHEYIEDLFHLDITDKPFYLNEEIDDQPLAADRIKNAQEVSKLFYNSIVWKNSIQDGVPVSLKGYVNIISKTVERFSAEIIEDFKLAHRLKYITIYRDSQKGLCLKAGANRSLLQDDAIKNFS